MRTALGGDNLDTPEELAQKGIVPNGKSGRCLSLDNRANGSYFLSRCVCVEGGDMYQKKEVGGTGRSGVVKILFCLIFIHP